MELSLFNLFLTVVFVGNKAVGPAQKRVVAFFLKLIKKFPWVIMDVQKQGRIHGISRS